MDQSWWVESPNIHSSPKLCLKCQKLVNVTKGILWQLQNKRKKIGKYILDSITSASCWSYWKITMMTVWSDEAAQVLPSDDYAHKPQNQQLHWGSHPSACSKWSPPPDAEKNTHLQLFLVHTDFVFAATHFLDRHLSFDIGGETILDHLAFKIFRAVRTY